MRELSIKQVILKVTILLLIGLVVHNRWSVPRISYDQMRQMVALENLMQGHGITYQIITDETDHVLLNNSFPVGYYGLLAPFYHVFNDPILLHRMFEILGILLLVWQLFLFGKWLEKRVKVEYLASLILLFSLIQLNPWRASGFTDIWALFLFFTALRLAICKDNKGLSYFILIGLFGFSTILMRYAYYPLAFVPPAVILIRFSFRSIRAYAPVGTLLLAIISLKIIDNWYFQGFNHLDGLMTSGRFFPTHVFQMDPSGVNAFFSDHVIFGALGLERWGPNTSWNLKYIFLTISLCILGYLVSRSFHVLMNMTLKDTWKSIFVVGCWLTILVNLGSITALSIYYPSVRNEFIYTWSLISRYFAPAYLLLQILIVFLLFQDQIRLNRKILASIIVLSFVFQSLYFGSFISRFSAVDTWSNYVKFYGREEMPHVMENYEMLKKRDKNFRFNLPEEHLEYEYLSIYYLSGNTFFLNEITPQCVNCNQFKLKE